MIPHISLHQKMIDAPVKETLINCLCGRIAIADMPRGAEYEIS